MRGRPVRRRAAAGGTVNRRGLAVVLAAAAALGACSVSTHRRAQVAGDDSVPFALLDPEAPPLVPTTAPSDNREPALLCFVSEGRLVQVERDLDAPVAPKDAVRALASPPVDEPVRARTALSDPLLVRDITVVAGVARVDLRASIADLGSEDQLFLVAQLVCTLTTRPGIGQVTFELEGTPIGVPRGDGAVVSQPVSRDDYAALLA